jgi:glycosyltransferase involved in cell wall biosynthesis
MAESSRSARLRRRLGRVVAGSTTSDRPAGAERKDRTPGRMLRAKPPNVRGKGPLLDGPGLELAVVAIVKNEAEYLEEWLAFHLALGVEHFFIYDNGSTDGSAELLERYINHGFVTRIDWPIGGGQLSAYNHALRMFGATTEWLAYFDPDEFLVPLLDDDIPTFLGRFDDAADVRVPRVEFGYSGHRTRPEGLAIDNYTQVANVLQLDPKLPPRVKSIVRPRAVSAVDIHLAFPADKPAPGQPTRTYEAEVRGVAQLSHYYTRSLEEFEAKRFRGSATGRIARPSVGFDVPTIEVNDAASRYSERTRVMLERLAQLDPKPYLYGSHIGFDYFPRPNDLFRFSEFAVANYAAGLIEPRRFATIRLKNLYRGMGLVADISDKQATPARDALSTSHHVAALVEHMRGRIVTGLSVAPELPVAAEQGTLTVPRDGPAAVLLNAGTAELVLPLPAEPTLRCYTLGLLCGALEPIQLEARLERADGSSSGTVTAQLPAAGSVAGIVEVEPDPVHGRQLRVRLDSAAHEIEVFDLFVIATG